MRRLAAGAVIWAVALVVLPASALASSSSGIETLRFKAGPYKVIPGANLILTDLNKVPKPSVNGFMIQMKPNLVLAKKNGKCCGIIPSTSKVHLHHGVWLSNGQAGQGEGNGTAGFYPFMAAGEEKTTIEFPPGYGYPVAAKDRWVLNYMIHNLTDRPYKIYITYDMQFVPETSPLAHHITAVHPIWMDVQSHHIYPVFDVHRGSGVNGKFTYPDMATDPYGNAAPLNQFTVDHAGTLIGTAGHLHPGGLYDQLDLIRSGAKPSGGAMPGTVPNSVRLFRSNAKYFDKRGPVSWDVSMGVTNQDWRPIVKPGDVMRISATYDSKVASWYEVMGIMVVWEAWNDTAGGSDPFTQATDQGSHLTHGHLKENSYYGGSAFVGVNPKAWAECARSKVLIAGFRYLPGDFSKKGGPGHCIPTVTKGHSLTFESKDASPKGTFTLFGNPFYDHSIFHTVTSCQGSCQRHYGIAYPLASGGPNRFDSGELGVGIPGVGTLKWSTPNNLPAGTYRYFCRIHPWMRGVFRIIR